VEQAGVYFLLCQGYTHEDAPGLIPQRLIPSRDLEFELEMRKTVLVGTKKDLDELEEEIQRIWDEAGPLTGLVNNAAGNFISPTKDLSANGFNAIATTRLNESSSPIAVRLRPKCW
jgi:hypothetical protein